MEHNAPHEGAAFEGYYSKFDLPSGAHLALVICKIKDAKTRPNALSFTYVPRDGSNIFQRELFVDNLVLRRTNQDDRSFIIDVPDIGYIAWTADSLATYKLEHADFSLHATTTSRTPWSDEANTPEGHLVNLPLPLHWHVHSLASQCNFDLKIAAYDLLPQDRLGEAIVHQEKNWANAFPTAHMWVQARDGERGFCCAGGEILGLNAFLLGYRSRDLNFDIRPPFAVRLAGIGPFLSYSTDWDNRTFELSAQTFRRKISIKAATPEGSFFSLSPPFADGHKENYLGQSFNAKLSIEIFESGFFGPWRLVKQDGFENASLEFGGDYYPPAGSESKFN